MDDIDGANERNLERFEEAARRNEERRRQLQSNSEENSRTFREDIRRTDELFAQSLIAFPIFLGGMLSLASGQLLQRWARRRGV